MCLCVYMYSVQFNLSVVSNSLWPHGLQHARLPYSSPTSAACSHSCPSIRWCHPTISSSVIPFSCLQSSLIYLEQCLHAKLLSHIRPFSTPWTVACQTSLFMEFSRQEYWSMLPFPAPGDLPNPGTKPVSCIGSCIIYYWATLEGQSEQ